LGSSRRPRPEEQNLGGRGPYPKTVKRHVETVISEAKRGTLVKNIPYTLDDASNLIGADRSTVERYANFLDCPEFNEKLSEMRPGWRLETTTIQRHVKAVTLTGCTLRPLGLTRTGTISRTVKWVQYQRPRPVRNIIHFLRNRPRPFIW